MEVETSGSIDLGVDVGGNTEDEVARRWELLVADAIAEAEKRLAKEKESGRARAVQLAREQGYLRLALAIDRPRTGPRPGPGQLALFPTDTTLFED